MVRDMDEIALIRRVLDLEYQLSLSEQEDPALRAEYDEVLDAAEDRLGYDRIWDFYRRLSMSRRTWWPDSILETRH